MVRTESSSTAASAAASSASASRNSNSSNNNNNWSVVARRRSNSNSNGNSSSNGSSNSNGSSSSSRNNSSNSNVTSNNNNRNDSDSSLPPSGVVLASASASAAAAAAAAASSSSSMSISDLVPLSMSVLRDKMMTDMNTEHEALKMKLEDRLRVEVIGPGGTYCRASLKNGVTVLPSPNGVPAEWWVEFDPNDTTTITTATTTATATTIRNFVETIAGLEVRVGGVVVLPFKGASFFTFPDGSGFDRTRDDTPQMGHVLVGNIRDNGVLVSCRVGPILFDNFVTLPRRMHVADLVRFLTDHGTNNPNDTVLLQSLDIKSVMIHKSRIEGILPLFRESMLPPGRCGCANCVSSVVATPPVVAVTDTTTAVDDEDDNEETDDSGCGYCYYYCCRRRRRG